MMKRTLTAAVLIPLLVAACAGGGKSTLAVSQTPIVGGVTDTAAHIIVRTTKPASVTLSVGQRTVTGQTQASSDNTVNFYLTGLQPGTDYAYTANVTGAKNGKVFHFRTFPVPGASENFKFVAITDELVKNPAPAFKTAAAENPAFVIQLGDFNHDRAEKAKMPTVKTWWTNERRAVSPDTPAGTDFGAYISPSFPFIHIWDDHDYGQGNGDKNFKYKSIAQEAFKDYYPTYDLPAGGVGLWQTFTYGRAQVFVLDNRSQRDPDNASDSPTKSMLGADQEAWLLNGLATSTATWKFIVTPSLFNPTGKRVDSWYQYPTERRRIVEFIRSHNIKGVILMSGDIHSGGGIDDGRNSLLPEITVPNTNTDDTDCTGTDGCGLWSEGVTMPSPSVGGGYALFEVTSDHVTILAKAANGSIRHSLTVTR
jgi:alkaline phosphatase D